MLAVLIGCGPRRGELLALRLESLQQREEHWSSRISSAEADTSARFRCRPGSGRRFDTWTTAAGITYGAIFRATNKTAEFGVTG